MEEIITSDHKNLELATQGVIVIKALATLAMAGIKIYKLVKNPTEVTPES